MRTLPRVNEILQRDDEEKATTEVFGSLIQETTKKTTFKQGEEMRNRISTDRRKDHVTFTPVAGDDSTVPSFLYLLFMRVCPLRRVQQYSRLGRHIQPYVAPQPTLDPHEANFCGPLFLR
jgi:hypothetical protein